MLGAGLKAGATADAAIGEDLQLGFGSKGLGVVAPEAAKVAALEKYSCPDSRPIMY